MDQIELEQIQVNKDKKYQQFLHKIRVITLQKAFGSYQYYSNYNLLVEEDYSRNLYFHSIQGNVIKYQKELSEDFNNRSQKKQQTLYIENYLILKYEFNFLKFNILNLRDYQSFNNFQFMHIFYCKQINRKSFIIDPLIDGRLRIYSIRNLKLQRTISSEFYVNKISYFNYIVQSKTDQYVYYFNQQMSKQIRKYCRFIRYLSELNSNYLFQPLYKTNEIRKQLTKIQIYDIQSMKLKGKLKIKNRKYYFHSFIFVNDLNILAVLYPGQLIDLYDLETLKFKRSQKLDQEYQSQIKYDKEHGLTLFQWLDTSNKIK